MLMRTAHGAFDAQVPHDPALRIGQGLEPGENLVPGAVSLPPAKQVVDPAPRPVLDGHIPPWHPGADPEPHAVDQLPPRPPAAAPPSFSSAKRVQHRALLIREISPSYEPRSFTAQDPLSIHDLSRHRRDAGCRELVQIDRWDEG